MNDESCQPLYDIIKFNIFFDNALHLYYVLVPEAEKGLKILIKWP